jgi:hypothetical protein
MDHDKYVELHSAPFNGAKIYRSTTQYLDKAAQRNQLQKNNPENLKAPKALTQSMCLGA